MLNDGAIEGIARSAARAENATPGWSEEAVVFLTEFARTKPDGFIAPIARRWCEEHGLSAPPSPYAWGGVFLKASRRGIIVRDGYEQYGDDSMHTQSVSRWKAA